MGRATSSAPSGIACSTSTASPDAAPPRRPPPARRHIMRPALLALLLPCIPASATLAQTRDVKTLTLDGARQVAAAAESEARRRSWDVAIAVVDPGGGLIVFHRMDGVQHASLDIAIEKART